MYEVLSIDAWRYEGDEGGWTWNAAYRTGVQMEEVPSTTRKLLKSLRDLGILSPYSAGRMRVEHYGEDSWEIQAKSTGEPLFAIQPVYSPKEQTQ